jgi:hypothetical protein
MDVRRYALASFLLITVTVAWACSTSPTANDQSAARNLPDEKAGNSTQAIAWVRLYENRDGQGNSTCAIDINTQPYYLRLNFKNDGTPVDCKNDHAKSARLENLNPGTTILLYSAAGCSTDEDWTRLDVLKRTSFIVWEFNLDEDHDTYRKRSHDGTNDRKGTRDVGQGGVGGAVSCMIIDMPGLNGERAGPVGETPGKAGPGH